jgi:flagellar protein FliO/FliZ
MNNILIASSWESFIQLLGALVIFAFVLVITYLATRWMGGMQKTHSSNKNLRIIETIGVGNNKYISIVEVGTVYLVVSVGKEEVHLLARLTRDELKDFSFEKEESIKMQDSFSELLKGLKDKVPKKQDKV